MSKIKDGHKLELQTSKTMKLFRSTNKLIDKIKNGEKVPRLEVVEIVLDQCNLVDNNHIQKSGVSYTCTPTKSYPYLLNVETSNLLLKLTTLSLMKLS